jgi:hypothetical protein
MVIVSDFYSANPGCILLLTLETVNRQPKRTSWLAFTIIIPVAIGFPVLVVRLRNYAFGRAFRFRATALGKNGSRFIEVLSGYWCLQ